MSTARAPPPQCLQALVHRLAAMRTPLNVQDAVLSVRALHTLRVYAPKDIQTVCEKAAFSLAAASASSERVEPAVLVDTINSMTALHAQILSASTPAGSAMQQRLCEGLLELDAHRTPSRTLQKACVALMKLYLPRPSSANTRVVNYVLRLVHERLTEPVSHTNEPRQDPLLCLAYIALFPYSSMARSSSSMQLEKKSLVTLLECAEGLVGTSSQSRSLPRELRGMEALQALHLLPSLALVHNCSNHNGTTSSNATPLQRRWTAVRRSFITQMPLSNIRVTDYALFVSSFADRLCRDGELLGSLVTSPLTHSGNAAAALSAEDLSRMSSSLMRAVSSRASTSASSDARAATASALTTVLTHAMALVTASCQSNIGERDNRDQKPRAVTDCAVVLANCWQAVRFVPQKENACVQSLLALTNHGSCVSSLVHTSDALYTVVLSLGARYSDVENTPRSLSRLHPSSAAALTMKKSVAQCVATLWRSWAKTRTVAPQVDAAFLLAVSSMLCSDLGHLTTGDATEQDDTLPCAAAWGTVASALVAKGGSDETILSSVKPLRRSREVRLTLDALSKLLRSRLADGVRFDQRVSSTVLQTLAQTGVAAIAGAIGGQKLALEMPWLPIQFLRLTTASNILSPQTLHSAYRVCAIALAKRNDLSVADMIKVLAALTVTDLHAAASSSVDELGVDGVAPLRPPPMDRDGVQLLDTLCSHHNSHLFTDEKTFHRRCPRLALLWRCAEAARRCGAVVKLEGDEDDFLAVRSPRRTGPLDQATFTLDVAFLTQDTMLAQLSPTDAAHLLRLMSETAPFVHATRGHNSTNEEGGALGAESDLLASPTLPLSVDLQSSVDALISLALMPSSDDSEAREAGSDYWRLLYLLNANRTAYASAQLFSLESLHLIVQSVTRFLTSTGVQRHGPTTGTAQAPQRPVSQGAAIANALLESCILPRLKNEETVLRTLRACLVDLQQMLLESPNREDQRTAVKLHMFL